MIEKKVFSAINTPLKDERSKYGLQVAVTEEECTKAQAYNERYEEGKRMF